MTTDVHVSRPRAAAGPDVGCDEQLTIAEVAERTGVSAHTLRYYERAGLVEVPRDESGHRRYDAAAFGRIVFLSRLRRTGMPIRDLQRYIALAAGGDSTVPERLALLQAHREAVRARIEELAVALETVDFKIAAYGGALAPQPCTSGGEPR